MLLNLAQSPRERECLRVAIVKASGISSSKARRIYGFEKMDKRIVVVEESLSEAQRIREAVNDLAQSQDKALLQMYGIVDETNSSDSYSESDEGKNLLEMKQHCFLLIQFLPCLHSLLSPNLTGLNFASSLRMSLAVGMSTSFLVFSQKSHSVALMSMK